MIIGISGKLGSGKDCIGRAIHYYLAGYHKSGYNVIDYEKHLIINAPGWQTMKFADSLKDIVCILTGCTRKDLEDIDFKNSRLSDEWNFMPNDISSKHNSYTYRELLQKLGTDLFRNQLHEDVWVNALMSKYKSKYREEDGFVHTKLNDGNMVLWKDHPLLEPSHYPNWIISDLRFPNELKAIKDKDGITIRVNRNFFGKNNDIAIVDFEDSKPHESETALDDAKFDYIITNDGTIEDLYLKVKTLLIELKLLSNDTI